MNGPFGLRRARCEEIAEFSGNDIPPHESASARLSRAVEDCAPPGSVTREDYLMPEFTMQAEALIRSIYAIAGRGSHRLAYAVRRLGCRAESWAPAVGIELIAAEAARPTEQLDALDYNSPGARRTAQVEFARCPCRGDQPVRASVGTRSAIRRGTEPIGSLAGRVLNVMTDSAAADLARAEALVNQAMAASPRSRVCAFCQRRCVVRAVSMG